jgi:hypothetical protein
MTDQTTSRLRAVITTLAPVALPAAFVSNPYIAARLPNA